MRYAIFAAVVPFLFCGCGCLRTPTAVEPDLEPALPIDVKLPAITGAKSLDKSEKYLIFLSVNEQGKVILAPGDQFKDGDGNICDTLENPAQVLSFLKRRAREDRDAAEGLAALHDAILHPRLQHVFLGCAHCGRHGPLPDMRGSRAVLELQADWTQGQWRRRIGRILSS